ncbi:GNAT family N-acetyltransferase [Clostridiaceae bacterium M8S5]|nr:GNAT family N-acetyltransferase [Clostridiaceae bacterium M8S5]
MGKLSIRYAIDEDNSFIDEMLKYSFNNSEAGIGYPRCEDLKELIAEIKIYENELKNCICIILYENERVGISGLLYSPEDQYGYMIGPIIKPKHSTKPIIKEIIGLVKQSKKDTLKTIYATITDENTLLKDCYLELDWTYKSTDREMCFDISDEIVYNQTKYQVQNLNKKNEKVINGIFRLFDRVFKWQGDRKRIEEFLKEGYKLGYVVNDSKEIIGAVCSDYLDDMDFSRLEYVAVDEKHRGKGIGRAMIEHVINQSANKNIKQVYLSTDIDNNASNLYSKIGFYDTVISHSYKSE